MCWYCYTPVCSPSIMHYHLCISSLNVLVLLYTCLFTFNALSFVYIIECVGIVIHLSVHLQCIIIIHARTFVYIIECVGIVIIIECVGIVIHLSVHLQSSLNVLVLLYTCLFTFNHYHH
eukprot:TRINITY_DN21251_c1_g1_i1.p1 TRINITY_DN21251_c1_g1~~TRINITY_DN21251_c1_g1_i1.p1  ORF type:complete len:119 (-),score=4.04 TRINITY_DN21251_c1_g1_i1:33-389(-)